ncbi:MAG: 2-phosphosulfolactate phosphatase [Bacteroidetes bacterium]|nr:2-phosphosulfolactate phosphatase [Bacteroidota bacterium]
MKKQIPGSKKGYLVAGERDGIKIPHFHFGNSPFEFMGEDVRGKEIIHTTTNGTRCVLKSKGARNIVAGSFVNQDAIFDWIKKENRNTILFCAGWKDHYVMDDALLQVLLYVNWPMILELSTTQL